MGFHRHKIYLLLAIILYSLNYAKGLCEMTQLSTLDGVCAATLQCEQVINFIPTTWNCIQKIEQVYDSNYYSYQNRYRQITTFATNYRLYVSITNADDQHDIFESVTYMQNIKTLQINDGYLLALPLKIYQLPGITAIEISNNPLSAVNLNRFVSSEQLTVINFRNNSISTLIMDTQSKSQISKLVKTIDLSQNLLETIPNTCFSTFAELQHLNLSYNKIRSFDILTFEGVMELKTLDVSHNMLFEIGNTLTRFIKLEELYLQNNELAKLADYNLNTLIKLKKLNLSFNMIDTVENNTFKSSFLLEYLDFSNNKIDYIPKQLFENNNKLCFLFLSNNRINHVDDGAFAGNNITEFNIKGNNYTGSIEKDTFEGVHVAELDLSGEKITSLGDETFKHMCQDLNTLNMSYNMISSISHSSLSCLEDLTALDLSHNHLEELNFETSDLKLLSKLNVSNNKIKKITKNVFKNLVSLKTVDVSYNKIEEIELQSFVGLENIEILTIMHNPFVHNLENNTFNGLVALKSIEMSFTRTTCFTNRSFSGLPALMYINSSFGQLSSIAYNTFIQTGSIKKLDLSHNLLEVFHVNTTSIPKVEEIYLNDNLIRHITNDTFSGLRFLRMLNLVNNNVQRMEAYSLKNVDKLSHLYLSSNTQMEIIGSPFDNLTNLYQVNLDGVKTKFTFENAISIDNLDLNLCGIDDLNKLSIFRVGDLHELNLSENKIVKIDKLSFQSLPFLITLDLSLNRIFYIQPGSFLKVNGLRKITLFGNNLQTLQFGVFDGIKALNYVNLSSNALQNFDAKLLPVALSIALDNNHISNLNFEDFFESRINKLSIGGNLISCKVLAELKTSKYSEKFKEVVTAASLDLHSENVDGISCQSIPKESSIVLPVANNTGYDMRPIFIQFTNAIEDLRSSIEVLGNSTPKKSYQTKPDLAKLVNSIQALVEISNQTQVKSEDYFKEMENITNATQIHLGEIKKQLTDLKNMTKDSILDHNANTKSTENNDDVLLEMKRMLKDEMDALREEFGNTYKNFQKRDPLPLAQVVEKESTDDKVLYFIAASLGMIIVLYIINLAYGYYKRDRRLNSLLSSQRPIANEIEME